MPRLEIRDIVVYDILRDTNRRLVTYIIHRYPYYSIFIFLFTSVFISIMITNPFCKYSLLIWCWNNCVYCIYFLILRLSAYMQSIFLVYASSTLVASPLLYILGSGAWQIDFQRKGRSITKWTQHHCVNSNIYCSVNISHLRSQVKARYVVSKVECRIWLWYQEKPVILHFPKYTGAETWRESAMYISEKNTPRIHSNPKVTWTSYINQLW